MPCLCDTEVSQRVAASLSIMACYIGKLQLVLMKDLKSCSFPMLLGNGKWRGEALKSAFVIPLDSNSLYMLRAIHFDVSCCKYRKLQM